MGDKSSISGLLGSGVSRYWRSLKSSKRPPARLIVPARVGVSMGVRAEDWAMASALGTGLGASVAGAPGAFDCNCACCCCCARRACSSCIFGTPTKYCQPNTTIIDSTTARIKLRCSDMETPVGTNEAKCVWGYGQEPGHVRICRQARQRDGSVQAAE